MVHCPFIFGHHGWLHSNQFCKTCQNCVCPSWRCLRCCSAAAWWYLPELSSQSNNSCIRTALCTTTKLGWRQFWHALQKLLLSSHPWTNMNNQCTIWKKNKYAIYHPLITISWFFLFNFERFRIESWFPFLNLHCIPLYINIHTVWVKTTTRFNTKSLKIKKTNHKIVISGW